MAVNAAKDKKTIETTADKDGLYYTKLLPAGNYKVRIYSNSHCYRANEINVPGADKTKRFYNFKLTGSKAILNIDEPDPFMAVAFHKIEANEPQYDFPTKGRERRVKYKDIIIDGTGMWHVGYLVDSSSTMKSSK